MCEVCALDEVNAYFLDVLAGDVFGSGLATFFGVDGEVVAAEVAEAYGVTVLQFTDDVFLEGGEDAFDVVFCDGALVADVLCHAVQFDVTGFDDDGIEGGFRLVLGIFSVQYDIFNHFAFVFLLAIQKYHSSVPEC